MDISQKNKRTARLIGEKKRFMLCCEYRLYHCMFCVKVLLNWLCNVASDFLTQAHREKKQFVRFDSVSSEKKSVCVFLCIQTVLLHVLCAKVLSNWLFNVVSDFLKLCQQITH